MKRQQTYTAPECDVISIALEGVIAQSVIAVMGELELPDFGDGGDLFD